MAGCPICGKSGYCSMYITFAGGKYVCKECYDKFGQYNRGEIELSDFLTENTASDILKRLEEDSKKNTPCDLCGSTNKNRIKKYGNNELCVCSSCNFTLSVITNADISVGEEDMFSVALALIDHIDSAHASERGKQFLTELRAPFIELKERRKNILVTTGYNFDGYEITEYLDVENAECIIGTGIFSELSNSVMDFFGVESKMLKSKLAWAKKNALERLMVKATYKGANGIIGIDYDILTMANNTFVVSINGTLVKAVKK